MYGIWEIIYMWFCETILFKARLLFFPQFTVLLYILKKIFQFSELTRKNMGFADKEIQLSLTSWINLGKHCTRYMV